ncbi:MAG: NADH-quinone oxidoreductase subunit N [Burkholderiaceae bacterium]
MTLTHADLLALLPLLVLSAAVVIVMLAAAFSRRARAPMLLALLGLALALASLPLAQQAMPRTVTPLLVVDGFALFYMGLVFAATFAVVVLTYGYFDSEADHRPIYILLLLAALGSAVLVMASHFATFLIGLEILSVSLFALVAFAKRAPRALEAGIKYLVLAGLSSAFLMFGMALIYADLGSLEFLRIARLAHSGHDVYLLAGLALLLVGIGFKLAVVPFHMWTPDIYEGASAPVAALVATVSKGAMLALMLRYFISAGGYDSASVVLALTWIAIVSMLVGNLLALLQNNVKRILAYSSIAHLGYMLVAFVTGGALAAEAIGYYLFAYFVAMLGAFGVVAVLSSGAGLSDTEQLADYRGLAWRRPWITAVFTAMLLSLAGIPLTMGFIAKFYVIVAGVDSALWLPVIVLVIGSAIGLVYYLRIIATMFDMPDVAVAAPRRPLAVASGLTLAVLTLLLLSLGVAPQFLIRLLGHAGMLVT